MYSHSMKLLSGLEDLRSSQLFCDVTLVVNKKEFPCHRNVLVALSPYFKAMFTNGLSESQESKVVLHEIDSDCLKILLDFVYTGHIFISHENVWKLFATSDFLQLVSVKDACCHFFQRHLKASNCIQIYTFAKRHWCLNLKEQAKAIAIRYFLDIERSDLLSLEEDDLIELLGEELDVTARVRMRLFMIAFDWLDHHCRDRNVASSDLVTMVKRISVPLLKFPIWKLYIDTLQERLLSEPCIMLLDELVKNKTVDSTNRTIPSCGNSGLAIVVLEGVKDDADSSEMSCYLPSNNFAFYECLPFPLREPRIVATDQNLLYVYGISVSKKFSGNSLWQYDPYFRSWKEKASTNIYRTHCGFAYLDGYIYAVGGQKGNALLSSVERYDPGTDSWEMISSMDQELMGVAAVGYKGYLYVAGGCGGTKMFGTDRVRMFCPATNCWSDVAPMSVARFFCAAVVMDDQLCVLGGWDTVSDSCTDLVECYDPAKDKWYYMKSMPVERFDFDAVVVDDKLHLFGGKMDNHTLCNSISIYHDSTKEWSDNRVSDNCMRNTSVTGVSCALLKIDLNTVYY